MADLQHAFVRRPDTDGFHIKSLDLEGSLQVWNLPIGRRKKYFQPFLQPNVLDLLRDSDDSGHHSPSRSNYHCSDFSSFKILCQWPLASWILSTTKNFQEKPKYEGGEKA